jgi:hypothetical protein
MGYMQTWKKSIVNLSPTKRRIMENYYISKEQKRRLISMMLEDHTKPEDLERISLFYILAGNERLYLSRNAIYDFTQHCIKPDIMNGRKELSSGILSLIKLGFNLYNGYTEADMTPMDLFWNLDHSNRQIAKNAIYIRFN